MSESKVFFFQVKYNFIFNLKLRAVTFFLFFIVRIFLQKSTLNMINYTFNDLLNLYRRPVAQEIPHSVATLRVQCFSTELDKISQNFHPFGFSKTDIKHS